MVYATCTLRAAENEAVGADLRCTWATRSPQFRCLVQRNCRRNNACETPLAAVCCVLTWRRCPRCRCSRNLKPIRVAPGRRTSSPPPSSTPGVLTWILGRLPSSKAAGAPRPIPSNCCRAITRLMVSSLHGTEGPPTSNKRVYWRSKNHHMEQLPTYSCVQVGRQSLCVFPRREAK